MTYADRLRDIVSQLETLIDEAGDEDATEAQAWRDAKTILENSKERAETARM